MSLQHRPFLTFLLHLAFALLGIVLASLTAALVYLGVSAIRSSADLDGTGDYPAMIGFLVYFTILLAGVPALLTRALMHVLGWRGPWPYMAAAAIVAAIASLYMMFGTEWIRNGNAELAGVALNFGLLGALCGLVFWLVAVRLPARLLRP